MVSLTKKQIVHIASLSNLILTNEEIKKFTPQLSKIIEYVGQLNQVETKKTKPTFQVTNLANVLREDKISSENILNREEVLSSASSTLNGTIRVKTVLSNRSNI